MTCCNKRRLKYTRFANAGVMPCRAMRTLLHVSDVHFTEATGNGTQVTLNDMITVHAKQQACCGKHTAGSVLHIAHNNKYTYTYMFMRVLRARISRYM